MTRHTIRSVTQIATPTPNPKSPPGSAPGHQQHHMTQLKNKFKRMCKKSTSKKQHLYLSKEILKANPSIYTYKASSFDARQDMLIFEVPKLGKEAIIKAIKEWGKPISAISHLIFCTTSGIDMPAPTTASPICFACGSTLRLAKDIAEARVLVMCSKIMAMFSHAPLETHLDVLIGQVLFADGAAAVIVGVDLDLDECPLFELVFASQTIVLDSEQVVVGNLREMGVSYYLLENCLVTAFGKIRISLDENRDWDCLFYPVHPGGRAILDQVEKRLCLKEGKMGVS
ncbi:hypothetical protein UlMin_035912 [Ulmus minor]